MLNDTTISAPDEITALKPTCIKHGHRFETVSGEQEKLYGQKLNGPFDCHKRCYERSWCNFWEIQWGGEQSKARFVLKTNSINILHLQGQMDIVAYIKILAIW